jgi:hypothetical protein
MEIQAPDTMRMEYRKADKNLRDFQRYV